MNVVAAGDEKRRGREEEEEEKRKREMELCVLCCVHFQRTDLKETVSSAVKNNNNTVLPESRRRDGRHRIKDHLTVTSETGQIFHSVPKLFLQRPLLYSKCDSSVNFICNTVSFTNSFSYLRKNIYIK